MPDITIHTAGLSSLDTDVKQQIVSNMQSVWQDNDPYEEDLNRDGLAVYVLCDEIVVASVVGWKDLNLSDSFYIAYLIVLPSHQGHGLGKILMKEMISLLQTKGYKEATLCVRQNNDTATHLYKKLGFEIKQKLTNEFSYAVDGTSNGFLMCKTLDESD